ncbi:uncharacterized protein [Palaemon carinicauda]|uniref:uncharacterized protein isoform X2 n=1 Tax=Palaemon carinicauda TaxID=392227 RepID=UPI0035B578F2
MAGIRNLLFWCLLAFLLVSDIVDCKSPEDCVIDYDSVPEGYIHPFVVGPNAEGFLYPSLEEKGRILKIPPGEGTIAACPGSNNKLQLNGKASATISCEKGSLYFEQKAITWSQLGCRSKLRPSLESEATSCGSSAASASSLSLRGTSYSVNWPISAGVVVPQIKICFNEEAETAIYTQHVIDGRHINAKIVEPDRPGFKKDGMFSVDVNRIYGKDDQGALFLQLLEDGSHLTEKKQHYLARGHLAPDSDFVLEAEQDATYFYANVVPQWQAVNNGNWKSLENSVRELAEIRGRAIKVWTGIHDVLHLPNANSDPIELFLGLSEKRRVIPVPALLWKVVYDRTAKEALAIVAVNDVRGFGSGSDPTNDLHDPPCRDVCAKATWVDWDTSDLSSGLTFCCSVSDIRKIIPTVPNLGRVKDLYSRGDKPGASRG